MTHSGFHLPADDALAAALAALVAPDAVARTAVRLVARRPNHCFSSSVTEVVTLALPDGSTRELFVKYGRPNADPEPRCRHDVAYCGLVYETIVRRLPVRTVRSFGTVAVGSPPVVALVLDHLADALRVNEAPDDSGLLSAAEWAGRLHDWGAGREADPALGFLARYDVATYRAWSARARRLAAIAGPVPAWLERACDDFDVRARMLVDTPQTIIHGEYGPQNVLWRDAAVHPVDWESAAVGPGEIDLATLLFDWPADTVRRAHDAYWKARGRRAPVAFNAAFSAATFFTALRWLPDPKSSDTHAWHAGLARLECMAARLG